MSRLLGKIFFCLGSFSSQLLLFEQKFTYEVSCFFILWFSQLKSLLFSYLSLKCHPKSCLMHFYHKYETFLILLKDNFSLHNEMMKTAIFSSDDLVNHFCYLLLLVLIFFLISLILVLRIHFLLSFDSIKLRLNMNKNFFNWIMYLNF